MEQNHCSVARKMMGWWQRQQCGYWWVMCCTPIRWPLSLMCSRMTLLASQTLRPANFSPASAVTLSHIKTVIYSSIAAWLLLLLVACPVFRFLSVLLRNVGRKEALNEENARMINYIGLVILIGNTLIVALNNLLNYIQINKFVSMSEHRIEYAFSIEWAGIIMGLFILAVGTIYGYACSVAAHEKETLTTAVTRLSGTGGQDGQG